jgi:hypothetical protein
MGQASQIQTVKVSRLKPYERNAKIHSRDQVERIAQSIKEFGFLAPCVIDENYNILAGHGRVQAAQMLGLESVPCVFCEGLTEEQKKAYILADNRLTELGDWDLDLVKEELEGLDALDFDINLTGFNLDLDFSDNDEDFEEMKKDFEERMAAGELSEDSEEYQSFLEKFEAKKTTDDCYTPDNIYDVVADYVAKTYKKKKSSFIRPFVPGGDYEHYDYPKGCIVVDNPPFSILSQILKFYTEHNIKFFLFGPGTKLFNSANSSNATSIVVGVGITYENGAVVSTSFLTNLESSAIRFKTSPELFKSIEEANKKNTAKNSVDKYKYPDCVVSAALLGTVAKYCEPFIVKKNESFGISELDAQKPYGKGIFGGGYLLSEEKAKEYARMKEEAAKRIPWELSDREKEIVKNLGKKSGE